MRSDLSQLPDRAKDFVEAASTATGGGSLCRVLGSLAALGAAPRTSTEIASHLGVSPEWVGAVLRQAPSSLVRWETSTRPHRWALQVDGLTDEELGRMARALRALNAASSSRRFGRSATGRWDGHIAAAHGALRRGDLPRAARIVRDRGLNVHQVLQRVSAAERPRLLIALAHLEADMAMIAGQGALAVRRARRAIELARDHAAHLLSELHVLCAVGHRMVGPGAWPRSVEEFTWALEAIPRASAENRNLLGAWVRRSISTPLALMGRMTEAERVLATAADLPCDDVGVAETLLLQARLALLQGATTARWTWWNG